MSKQWDNLKSEDFMPSFSIRNNLYDANTSIINNLNKFVKSIIRMFRNINIIKPQLKIYNNLTSSNNLNISNNLFNQTFNQQRDKSINLLLNKQSNKINKYLLLILLLGALVIILFIINKNKKIVVSEIKEEDTDINYQKYNGYMEDSDYYKQITEQQQIEYQTNFINPC